MIRNWTSLLIKFTFLLGASSATDFVRFGVVPWLRRYLPFERAPSRLHTLSWKNGWKSHFFPIFRPYLAHASRFDFTAMGKNIAHTILCNSSEHLKNKKPLCDNTIYIIRAVPTNIISSNHNISVIVHLALLTCMKDFCIFERTIGE